MPVHRIVVTREDIDRYKEQGYWISPKLIDDDTIERLRQAHDRIWEDDYDGEGYLPFNHQIGSFKHSKGLRRISNAWWINDEVRSVVTDPMLGRIAAQLMETDGARLWLDQAIWKPGAPDGEPDSGNVGWHQDYAYWQCCSTPNMTAAWIALQDTDVSNGAMMFVPGSHQWGLVPGSNSFRDPNLENAKQRYTSEHRPWVEQPCILKAGQASFHHALTFHGSGPNRTGQARLSIVAHLMPPDTAYVGNKQYHSNVDFLGPRPVSGQWFEGKHFPLVYGKDGSL